MWTVGFFDPSDNWFPESDHDTEYQAAQRAQTLNVVDIEEYGDNQWLYKRTEPNLYTVGCYDGLRWYPFSDHTTKEEAANMVIKLNQEQTRYA